MADSLGVLQQYGSPDITSLITIIGDNIDHVYTLDGHYANQNTTTTSITFNNEYSAFLIWYQYLHSGAFLHDGFFIAKSSSTIHIYATTAYMTINSSSASITCSNSYHVTATFLGII